MKDGSPRILASRACLGVSCFPFRLFPLCFVAFRPSLYTCTQALLDSKPSEGERGLSVTWVPEERACREPGALGFLQAQVQISEEGGGRQTK